MSERQTILVVEDDAAMRDLLEDELREAGYAVVTAAEGNEALEQIGQHRIDAVVSDLQMPGLKGRDLLDQVRLREPTIPVVIITAFGSIDSAVDAIKAGAFHFVSKPFQMDQLLVTLNDALSVRAREQEMTERMSSAGRSGIVAECQAMQKTLDVLRRAAGADSPVLLVGESGTGKELLARCLHTESPHRKGRFVAVNCAAAPEPLLESQLFGERQGAETREGLFQEARGGTIFLDEIGDMSPLLQGKLLRVLQDKEVLPVGATSPVPLDVRVVAAGGPHLDATVAEGRFRQDLYYRLSVIVVRVPPLRERREDVLPLIAYFLRKHGERLGKNGYRFSPAALDAMMRHSWPGNVRELENAVERALVLGQNPVMGLEDLPEALWGAPPISEGGAPARSVAHVERDHILKTLRAVAGNKAAAARLLGVDRKTLYRKLKAYGIDP